LIIIEQSQQQEQHELVYTGIINPVIYLQQCITT
jgi:hypothetical protein